MSGNDFTRCPKCGAVALDKLLPCSCRKDEITELKKRLAEAEDYIYNHVHVFIDTDNKENILSFGEWEDMKAWQQI